MKLRAIILGCGSSAGVPRIGGPGGGGDWGACDPNEPKNLRTRSSIVVQRADENNGWDTDKLTTVIVDTSPDLRTQLIRCRIGRADGVLFTHDHADQTHGIDDLRVLVYIGKKRIPAYVDDHTSPSLVERFRYCFEDSANTGYPAILDLKGMPPHAEWFNVDGPTGPIPIKPLCLRHGKVDALGFRFGRQGGIAYSPDTNDLPQEAFDHLVGTDTWIVDALRYDAHVSHAHLAKTLDWIAKSQVRRGVLTNMHIDLDYATVQDETPDHVDPAFDGMIVEADGARD